MATFHEGFPYSGVDEFNNWMMVPHGRQTLLRVYGGPDVVLNYNPRKLEVDKLDSLKQVSDFRDKLMGDLEYSDAVPYQKPFVGAKEERQAKIKQLTKIAFLSKAYLVGGKAIGPTVIEAIDGKTRTRIDVSVKRELRVRVNCTFIRHRDNPKASTHLIMADDVRKLFHVSNLILHPQANILLTRGTDRRPKTVDWETMMIDVNPSKVSTLYTDTFRDMVKEQEAGVAHIRTRLKRRECTVFFVAAIMKFGGDSTDSSGGFYVPNTTYIVIPNKESIAGYADTLTHEIVHFLGAGDEFHCKDDARPPKSLAPAKHCRDYLMGPAGWAIPRQLVNKANP